MSTPGQKVAEAFTKSPRGQTIERMKRWMRSFEFEINVAMSDWNLVQCLDFLIYITNVTDKTTTVRKKKQDFIRIMRGTSYLVES